MLKERILTLVHYRSLLGEFVSRDIKIRYRRSVLGLLWTVLNPLLMMVVLTFVFSRLFDQDIPYFPIYYLSGSLLFTFNSEATTNGMTSIIMNSALIKKVYIPKYIFPMAKVLSGLVNMGFSLIAMILVMLVLRVPFRLTMFLLPVPVLYTFVFSLGLALFLSAVAVRFRDICHFYNVFVLAWTYFTPLVYPVSILPPAVMTLMKFNPMYHFVDYSRALVLEGRVPSLIANGYCIVFSLLMLIIGLRVFYKMQDSFILYV